MSKSSGDSYSGALKFFVPALFLFFVSGYCGLLYQVVWTRKLVLILGTTSYAVSTVLCIFFLGLAFGSLWGGRLADRHPKPMFLYGIFEIIIGFWAMLFIFVLNATEDSVLQLLADTDVSRFSGVFIRAGCSAALLFVPVFLMGATLPILSKFVNRTIEIEGRRIALLYSLNTLGAVAGCFSTGFFLLPEFGYTNTTYIGGGLNILIGIGGIFLSMISERGGAEANTDIKTNPVCKSSQHIQSRDKLKGKLVLSVFFLSGFSALAIEVLWTRLLAIVFLGTTYAFTTMLTTLLLGIALGSAVAAALVDKIRFHTGMLGITLLLTAVSILFQPGWIASMPEWLSELQAQAGNNWNRVILDKVWLSFLVLFLPTFGFGMTFPFVVKIIAQSGMELGKDVGRIYFINTIGGTLGAVAGGYLILPLLGTHWGIILLALVLLFCAGILVLISDMQLKVKMAAGVISAVLLSIAVFQMPEDVNLSLNAGYVPEDHEVLHYREGVEGTVTVSAPVGSEDGSDRVLFINRVQATTTIERGVKMNRFQGVLPLLFDRKPETVLFICLGSGITCGTLALHEFERIDAVDISEDVLDAAPYFEKDNLGVLKRPNINFHINDGRNYLKTSRDKYDLISFEPMPLAMAGVSTFYSEEFYFECLNHLNEGGFVSQWIPFHSLNPEIVRSLTYTFTQVFPEYCAFFVNADLFLIGSDRGLKVDYAGFSNIYNRNGELQQALHNSGFNDALEVVSTFVMDKEGVDQFAAGGRVMSDERPWAEFEAPKLVYNREVPETVRIMEDCLTPIESILLGNSDNRDFINAVKRRHRSHIHDFKGLKMYYSGMLLGEALPEAFLDSLDIDPDNMNARYYLKDILLQQGELMIRWEKADEIAPLVERALNIMPDDQKLKILKNKLDAASQ